MRRYGTVAVGALLLALMLSCEEHRTSLVDGTFERVEEGGPVGWTDLWTRDPNAGKAALDAKVVHGGAQSIRIEHTGGKDWSLSTGQPIEVKPGDLFVQEAWVKVEGQGRVTSCATTRDAKGKPTSWTYGGQTTSGPCDWRLLRSRFVIPKGVATIEPRVIGVEPATIWVDDFAIVKEGNVMDMRPKNMPEALSIGNAALDVTLHTADATISVKDKRTGQTWTQKAVSADNILMRAGESFGKIGVELLCPSANLKVKGTIQLDGDRPELAVTLSAEGDLAQSLSFPHPFVTDKGTYLVVPMNEGISYPVDDESIQPMRLVAYGGHGICMAFFGATDGEKGCMAILETSDDASIQIGRIDGRLYVAPMWDAQKGRFGYERKLRYVFLDKGGHAAMCRRYREHAKQAGLVKTLSQKRKENPNVDLLIGAVNVWCWEKDAPAIVKEMQAAGIARILWSNRGTPESIKAMNEMPEVLTSRYDIYQDLMDPQTVKEKLGGHLHSDWTQEGWPKDIMLDERGDWRKGWQVKGRDGVMYPCGVLCDRRAPDYARERVPKDLAEHPYRCRFIDTTTASPWRECYHPDHPLTRSESRRWKMELLRYMSEDMKLVTGCETGHEASVPYLHYFEGMLSLGPYRVADAGRKMMEIWDEVPERVEKFQMGHRYRLPLWELVYHDCVVAQWYWGDYNNKLPKLWDKRDLFNILYGTPPMFMFNRKIWNESKARFVQSYKAVCPVVRAVGYAEMTDHRFLTPDRDVQQTTFSNGVTVTVNFGSKPFKLADGTEVKGMGCCVMGM
ncbi:MAG: glycoside hydrolase [Planctomycetota bacterium]